MPPLFFLSSNVSVSLAHNEQEPLFNALNALYYWLALQFRRQTIHQTNKSNICPLNLAFANMLTCSNRLQIVSREFWMRAMEAKMCFKVEIFSLLGGGGLPKRFCSWRSSQSTQLFNTQTVIIHRNTHSTSIRNELNAQHNKRYWMPMLFLLFAFSVVVVSSFCNFYSCLH